MKYPAAFLLLVCLFGCEAQPDTQTPGKVTPPDQLSVDGATWERQAEMTPASEQMLSRYFQKNPSVAGNPLVSGQPTYYTAGTKTRFYWLSALEDQVNWFFLEFNNSQFVTAREGVGEPFAAPAP